MYPILYNEDSTHTFEINPYRRNYDNINDVNYFSETSNIESFEDRANMKRPLTTPIKTNTSSPTRSQIYDNCSFC